MEDLGLDGLRAVEYQYNNKTYRIYAQIINIDNTICAFEPLYKKDREDLISRGPNVSGCFVMPNYLKSNTSYSFYVKPSDVQELDTIELLAITHNR